MQLNGVRILDLTRLLPGPYATQLLADSGAEVIKVEDTGAGDYARHGQPRSERDVGAIFEMVNRGKKSVSIDLKSDEGTEAFYRLVESADVVFEQFRPGVVDRLGIDYETLCSYNEDLIYCSLTGYGQEGPWSDRAGHDLNYVGLAGLLDMTRESPSDKPQMPGYPIGDMSGGLFSAFAITEALLSRELGNTNGEYIDVAMSDVVASFSQSVTYQALTGDPAEPRPGETALSGKFPWYDSYATADGKWVTLAALEPKFWRAFCEAVGAEHLIDAHDDHDTETFATVRAELEDLFAERTREEWEDALGDVDAAFGGVYTPAEMVEHPQLEAREMIERPENAPSRIGFPARSSEAPAGAGETLPAQGEHTDSVLSAVGYSDAELEELRDADAIR
ncbi:Crotonobetainyl-CoA:carnitine CoA-transferase CaiB [Natronorubrum sediminis]|uniref:Crotonobetainyl-CoA:carnitine CoA-transferase CaiB n=1 Tax=Natronorubrum sediminis TaxID=640943 RepID=A0A1H6G4J1_9EURY|nr:CaiB/BaiF CoA-transferase family protein [Natronorubrum sediminis]SEH17233.1 Crotonobetainyl-CoA:carnitine CoA-transferase CaiB [Natronorubrum sediminis]